MVGVHMGFQQPVHGQVLGAHEVHQLLRAGVAGVPGGGVIVEHRIHQRAASTLRVDNHIADGIGDRIEKTLYLRDAGGGRGHETS